MIYYSEPTRSFRTAAETFLANKKDDEVKPDSAELGKPRPLSAAESADLSLDNKVAAAEAMLQEKITEADDLELRLKTLQERNATKKEADRTSASELRALKEKIYGLKNDIGHLRDLVWAKSAIDVKQRGLENFRQELTGIDPESADFDKLKNALKTMEDEVVELTTNVANWDWHKRNPRLRVVTDPEIGASETPPIPEPTLAEQISYARTQLAIRRERLAKLQDEFLVPQAQRQSRLDDLALQRDINELRKVLIPDSQNLIAMLEQTTGKMPAAEL